MISKKEEGLTVLKFSSRILSKAPSGMLRKFLRNRNIEFNKKRSDGYDRLKEGDRICFFLSDETFEKFSEAGIRPQDPLASTSDKKVPELEPERILYEDEDFLFYDKPAGILSQSDSGGEPSLNDSLLKYTGITDTVKASVCNRLDRNTSGIILCGKSYLGLKTLDEAIRDRRIEKYYLCVLEGSLKREGEIRVFLKKDRSSNKALISETEKPGFDEVITGFKIIKKAEGFTVAEAHLITGKPHQIRAVSSFLGAPVAGDKKYGASRGIAKRQLLHSFRTRFPEDILEGKTFEAPIPPDMLRFM